MSPFERMLEVFSLQTESKVHGTGFVALLFHGPALVALASHAMYTRRPGQTASRSLEFHRLLFRFVGGFAPHCSAVLTRGFSRLPQTTSRCESSPEVKCSNEAH